MASEARLASFFAIAKGDIPARHWFHLGRTGDPRRSWRRADFLVGFDVRISDAFAGHAGADGSLLDATSRLVVGRQIAFADKQNLPWGISESAYNARDLELTYQYSNFGIPGLGLKRGLADNFVVAPYATGLAAMVNPASRAQEFGRGSRTSARSGDMATTRRWTIRLTRVPEGENFAIVRAFMAHHQGMTIVAIANTVLDGKMRARFHAEPMIQATELLLQERMPRDVAVAHNWAAEMKSSAKRGRDVEPWADAVILTAINRRRRRICCPTEAMPPC